MPLKKDLGQWISHFGKSDAPQFKGKSEEERKNMALAAYRGKYGSLNETYTSATNNELAQYIATLKDELAYYKQKEDTKRIEMTKKDLADVKAELESRRAKRGVNEASEEEETEFHKKLDTLVHSTFGKREDELQEEVNQKQAEIYAYQFMQYFDKIRGVVRHNFGDDTRKEFERLVQSKFSNYTVSEVAKPDFLDLDKHGNTEEPMKQAAKNSKLKHEVIAKVVDKIKEVVVTDDPKEAEQITKSGTEVKLVPKGSIKEGREFDYEGSMARTQLFSIIKNSKSLFDQIDDRTQLQGWVQSKLTKAEDYIDAVRTYLEGESLSTTTPLVVSEEMMKDEEGASLNIGDVVKAGDGGIYQVIFSYMEGKPFLVPFDLKKRKPTNLRNRIYFDSDSMIVRKLHKVMPFSATKGGFMK
jgi:hypothetical protein